MAFTQIPNFPRAAVVSVEDLPSDPADPCALLCQDIAEEPLLQTLIDCLGDTLLLPECWRDLFPQAGVLISSAVSGGNYSQRLEEAALAAPGRCWLLLEPMSVEFTLPCRNGEGKNVLAEPAGPVFFSDSLCCWYTHCVRNDAPHVHLFDTEESLQEKLVLAQKAGFLGYVTGSTP